MPSSPQICQQNLLLAFFIIIVRTIAKQEPLKEPLTAKSRPQIKEYYVQ